MDFRVPRRSFLKGALSLAVLAGAGSRAFAQTGDPLPSWQDRAAKQQILSFVAAVTSPGSPDFVPPAARIAVFDNDGTLWPEQPMYVQLAFALDRIRALAPQHPEWKEKQPFKAALAGDFETLSASGMAGLLEIMLTTHAGNSTDEFARIVTEWLAVARHPRFARPYTDLAYQPMLEVLTYLRAQGFRTCIVSGGGVEFMRPWTDRVYGVPPEQVIGSSIKTQFAMRADGPVLIREPAVTFIDDGPGKPVGINAHLGVRPIAAFGNSDGDFEMLQWTTQVGKRSLGMIVHHTDSVREYAYDRHSPFGRLDRALDAAAANKWTLISMKDDWRRIFTFEG